MKTIEIMKMRRFSEAACRAVVQFVVGRLNEPMPNFQGRGIVICAGGPMYLREAFVNVNRLREIGCELPVQIWHLGEREIAIPAVRLFRGLDVQFIDALEVRKEHEMPRIGGWECKIFAIKYAPFLEVLLLDADSHAEIQPEELFDSPEFGKNGAVLFPDVQRNRKNDMIFPCLGILPYSVNEHEAGQVMYDKTRHWPAIQFACWMAANSDFFFKYLHGEKDFHGLAMARMGDKWMEGRQPAWGQYGQIQHFWPDGRLAFSHYMNRKRDSATLIPERHRELFAEWDAVNASSGKAPRGPTRSVLASV